jgi:hypothetical protein
MSDIEPKIRHLEMIQTIINRMAGNLFFLRGWAVTLIAALFALSAKDTNHTYIFIAFFPAFIFWIFDGYFLSQERRFRDLYNKVREIPEKDIDFSMNTKDFKKKERNSWFNAFCSPTLSGFYVPLLLLMLFIIYLIK